MKTFLILTLCFIALCVVGISTYNRHSEGVKLAMFMTICALIYGVWVY